MSLCPRRSNILEIETTRTLSDTAGSEASTGAVGGAGVEGSAYCRLLVVIVMHGLEVVYQ